MIDRDYHITSEQRFDYTIKQLYSILDNTASEGFRVILDKAFIERLGEGNFIEMFWRAVQTPSQICFHKDAFYTVVKRAKELGFYNELIT